MVVKKKTKKISKKRSFNQIRPSTVQVNNNILAYSTIAVFMIIFTYLAFTHTNQKSSTKSAVNMNSQEVQVKENKLSDIQVKENKVSDIKVTKEVKPLNIPKKKKAINSPVFNEKAVQIRFAEIDYNSNKKISLREYLYYFKDKEVGKKKFKSIDKNNDRKITYKEYLASRK
tara:strand:+ start:1426 stop:1941 length:516 start_codon:yes stop_codon:yes gene_type:complete